MKDVEEQVRSWTEIGLIMAFLAFLLIIYLMGRAWSVDSKPGELMDTLVKGATIIGGLAFFVYKVGAGSLGVSTSLTLSVTLHRMGSGQLWGAMTLEVKRGDIYAVEIKELYLLVNEQPTKHPVPFIPDGCPTYYLIPANERSTASGVSPSVVDGTSSQQCWSASRSFSMCRSRMCMRVPSFRLRCYRRLLPLRPRCYPKRFDAVGQRGGRARRPPR